MKKTFSIIKFDIIFWTIIFLIDIVTIYKTAEPIPSIIYSSKIILILILPVVPGIYGLSFIFKTFYLKNKYFLFWLLTLIVVFGYGFIIDYLTSLIFNDGTETNGFFSLLIYGSSYIGIKYLKISTKYKHQLKLEEEKQKNTKSLMLELEMNKAKSELELLKNQLSPHFVFNTLNTIYSLALDKSAQIPEAILKMSNMYRYILDNSDNKYVSLKKECNFIADYIDLEKLRFEEYRKINYKIKGDINNKNIAPMILITFVENCFKHGISINKSKSFVEINLNISGNNIIFEVRNSIPDKKNSLTVSSGKGIVNVKRRLEFLYPEKYDLIIKQEPNFFYVKLIIDLS